MNENFLKWLDEGGRFVIKKQDGKIMIAAEIDIEGKKHHIGIYVDGVGRDFSFEEYSIASLTALRRLKEKKWNKK